MSGTEEGRRAYIRSSKDLVLLCNKEEIVKHLYLPEGKVVPPILELARSMSAGELLTTFFPSHQQHDLWAALHAAGS